MRALGGERTERVEERDADGVRIRRRPFGVLEDERQRERSSLRRGESSERLVEHGLQEVADAGERQRRLALGRACQEDAERPVAPPRRPRPPEGGLSDSGLAFEDERRRSVGDAGDEITDGRELGVPADDAVGHASDRTPAHDAATRPHAAAARYSARWDTRSSASPRSSGSLAGRHPPDDRAAVGLDDAVAREHLALPARHRGKRHPDPAQEEVFVVLEGALTVDLGEPPERHELERGSVLVVQPGTILQLRNAGDEELVLFIYGAPPVTGQAEFFHSVPCRRELGGGRGRATLARSNASSPSRASTRTVSPSANRPSSSSSASGFSSSRWIARFSGRAP